MNEYNKELEHISYNTASLKIANYSFHEYDTCFNLHWHERLEFLRVNSGELCIKHGKDVTTLREGELFLILPRIPHHGYTLNTTVQYDVLMFDIRSYFNDTEICKTLFTAIWDRRTVFQSKITDTETLSCFDSILNTDREGSLKTVAEIYRFLTLLFANNLLEIQCELSKDDNILNIMQYMEEHFQSHLSINDFANHFGYSHEYFCRKFKNATGLTPSAYMRIYRLEQALELLSDSQESIREIAEYCGFDDANYFTRCFKAHYGMSPTQFRKN